MTRTSYGVKNFLGRYSYEPSFMAIDCRIVAIVELSGHYRLNTHLGYEETVSDRAETQKEPFRR